MNAIENELSDVIKRDKKHLIELEFARDGVASTLQEFLEVCKEISETLGVDIYFNIPNNNDTCNCGIYMNDVHVGVCIISNNKDTKSKLNTILNSGNMSGVRVNEHLNPNSDNLQSGSTYMTIRVDYTFDGNITQEDDVLDEIASRVTVDSKANGLNIDEVEFCGWNDADNVF